MRLLLATENRELDEYIRENADDDIEVVGEVYYREALVDAIRQYKCDTVLLSIYLNGEKDILDVIFLARMADARIIVLMNKDDERAHELVAMGVYDLLFSPVPVSQIMETLKNPKTFSRILKELGTPWRPEAKNLKSRIRDFFSRFKVSSNMETQQPTIQFKEEEPAKPENPQETPFKETLLQRQSTESRLTETDLSNTCIENSGEETILTGNGNIGINKKDELERSKEQYDEKTYPNNEGQESNEEFFAGIAVTNEAEKKPSRKAIKGKRQAVEDRFIGHPDVPCNTTQQKKSVGVGLKQSITTPVVDLRARGIAVMNALERAGGTSFAVALAKAFQTKGYKVRVVDVGGGISKWLRNDSIECSDGKEIAVLPGCITIFDSGSELNKDILPLAEYLFIIVDGRDDINPTWIMPYVPGKTYLIGTKGADEEKLAALAELKMVNFLFSLPEAPELLRAEQEGKGVLPKNWRKYLDIIVSEIAAPN